MVLESFDITEEYHFIRMHYALDNAEKWRTLWHIQRWTCWTDARLWLLDNFNAIVSEECLPLLNFLIRFPSKEEKVRFIITWL